MIRSFNALRTIVLSVLILPGLFLMPYYAHAQQSAGDLRASIQGSLLSDPRTSGLSQAEISGIVDVLTEEAQKNGMTSQDIFWQPQNTNESFSTADVPFDEFDTCGDSLLCDFNEAFGFVGNDLTIPFILGVASMGLIWIVAEMLHRHRQKMTGTKPPASA